MKNRTPQEQPTQDGTRERVTGPFKGYHVVALGCLVESPGTDFRGRYKICRGHPDNYWTAEPLLQGECEQLASSGWHAMRMAECDAAGMIGGLAPNSPNAGWGYGCSSMIPFLREQREARSGQVMASDPRKLPRR